MSKSVGNCNEYVGVVRIVNSYAAIHVKGTQKQLISERAETDLKTAQSTAQSFAAVKNVALYKGLLDLQKPIISVYKHNAAWYPAEFHSDKITLLKFLGPLPLGGSQQDAIYYGKNIALDRGVDFMPSIGLSITGSDKSTG